VHNALIQLATLQRWQQTSASLGIRSVDAEYRKLMRAWRSWGRRYHTLDHLNACLREFDLVRQLAERPAEVELALWFHDAVYKTRRSDNEVRSAAWATEFLESHGTAKEVVARVAGLVLATAHNVGELSGDAALTVDIDLSILGQPREVYDVFERNVRREYWWVPKKRFVAGRTRILQSFLDRPTIYHWPVMRDKFEVRARENLARATAQLAKS